MTARSLFVMIVLMNTLFVVVALALFGLALGSFAGATVWRLRARQLKLDAKFGEKILASEKAEVAKLQKKPVHSDRSVCLHCGHELKWYDLLPLVSWVLLRGKCRYCHKGIGWFEPAIEVGLAAFFVVSFLFWPGSLDSAIGIVQFIVWLVAGFGLAILFAYDAKWYLLPNVVVFPLIGVGVIKSLLVIVEAGFSISSVVNVIAACAVLSGLYFAVYILSRRQWVGFGDVKLSLALALLLADWQLAILALFLANLVGTLIFLPAMVTGKLKRQAHIPFGPLLITGWVISGLFGAKILYWYMTMALGVS